RRLAGVEGVVDLSVEPLAGIDQVQVRPRRDAALRHGIHVGALADVLETALAGRVVGQVIEGSRSFDVRVRYRDGARDLSSARAILLDTPAGRMVPLSSLADVVVTSGPYAVRHDDGQRRVVVSC